MTKYLTEKDFSYSKEKPLIFTAASSSKASKIRILKVDSEDYEKGSKWLLKQNQFDWIGHEYVASKLYQWALGKDIISDTILVRKKKDPTKPFLATKIMSNYLEDFNPISPITMKAGEFSVKCMITSCRMDGKKMSIPGFENAFVASRLFDEGDDTNFLNYAIITLEGKNTVTRYDFDDSLKFFHLDGITQGMREESLNSNAKQGLLARGLEFKDVLDAVNKGMAKKDFDWEGFIYHTPVNFRSDIFTTNIVKLLEAFDYFIKLDRSEVKEIIKQSFAEITEISGEDVFAEYYNIELLDELLCNNSASCDQVSTMSNSEKVAEYANNVIQDNFAKLEVMNTCLKAEVLIKSGDMELLQDINSSIDECGSLFSYPDTFRISDFVNPGFDEF
jgi:hypothetical protein